MQDTNTKKKKDHMNVYTPLTSTPKTKSFCWTLGTNKALWINCTSVFKKQALVLFHS